MLEYKTTKIRGLERLVKSMDKTAALLDKSQEALHKHNVKQREALEKIIEIAEGALKP